MNGSLAEPLRKQRKGEKMGKHDKPEMITANVMSNAWYEARIKTVERENIELKHRLDKEEEAYEYSDEMHKQVIAELEARIAELEAENSKLKESLIKEILK